MRPAPPAAFPLVPASATAFAAGSPMQSVANATGCPSSSCNRVAMGARLSSGAGLPFGRPRWLASTTVAPRSSAYLIVGSEARMRVSSPMTPFSSGTLKSTRTNTRRPDSSRSVMDSFGTGPRVPTGPS